MLRVRLLLVSWLAGALNAPLALAQQTEAAADGGAAVQAGSASAASPAPATPVEAAAEAPPAAPPVTALESTAAPAAPAPTPEQPAQPGAAPQQATRARAAVSLAQARDLHDAVHFVENDGRHVTLFEKKGDQWLQVCTSPCYFTAPGGPRDYAAPIKAGPATAGFRVAGKDLWLVNGDGLQAEFKDRSQVRKIGIGVMVAGLVTLAFLAPALDAENRTAAKAAVLTTSGALTVSGLIMLLMKDRMQLSRCVGCNAPPVAHAGP